MTQRSENGLAVLRSVGFVEAGRWRAEGGSPRLELTAMGDARDALYAFVSGDEVLYLGKTVKMLKERLYFYQNPGKSQRSNIRINGFLKELLDDGRAVSILAFSDQDGLAYKGVPLNIAAGLEDNLISLAQPLWNKTGM